MKNYGNMVKKYASSKVSSKYKSILAKSNAEYEAAQLADLERFLKYDLAVPRHSDNQGHYNSLIAKQKKVIEAEIARLKGQVVKVVTPILKPIFSLKKKVAKKKSK